MTDRFQDEYIRALWRSRVAQLDQLSLDDIRKRADYLRAQFDGSQWVPWVGSACLAVFFGTMLLTAAAHAAHTVGAVIGLVGAVVPAGYMTYLKRWERPHAASACVESYARELARQAGALKASALTIAMMMTGAGLLSVPSGAGGRQALLSAAGFALTGLATSWFLLSQARRYDRRLVDVRKLSR